MVMELSIVFGLLIGGMWMGEILLGNLQTDERRDRVRYGYELDHPLP
jgi:hypothetical protein